MTSSAGWWIIAVVQFRTAALLVGSVVVIAGVVCAGLIGFAAGHYSRGTSTVTVAGATTSSSSATVSPTVAAGAHEFVQFACAQCHGPQGRGGVSPYVPPLAHIKKTLTSAQLSSIINHGLGESANPTKPYMPVWGQVISATQVDDLVAYIHAGLPAVPTAEPPAIPQGQGEAVQGASLYVR